MGMTPSDLRERVKETIANGCGCDRYCERPFGDVCVCKTDADAAIALVLEEAAKAVNEIKVKDPMDDGDYGHNGALEEAVAAIRALNGKNDPQTS
jgi:hypothetical protein